MTPGVAAGRLGLVERGVGIAVEGVGALAVAPGHADGDADPSRLTEMDALVAYLQQLGTHVDFRKVEPHEVQR